MAKARPADGGGADRLRALVSAGRELARLEDAAEDAAAAARSARKEAKSARKRLAAVGSGQTSGGNGSRRWGDRRRRPRGKRLPAPPRPPG
jgi:hypothetical protein